MTRAFLTFLLLGTGILAASPGCADEGVGDPCVPEQEYEPTFGGFDRGEVNVESKSFQCRTRVCLVNHFQGRASCPYGQDREGIAPEGADGCTVPGTTDRITGSPDANSATRALVRPQCVDRTRSKAVYCSCRCADINGQRPSGQAFCECPDGFVCSPLVTSIGQGNEGLTGSYCILSGTEYNENTSCNQGECNPDTNPCTD